jgi:hypothetical protein
MGTDVRRRVPPPVLFLSPRVVGCPGGACFEVPEDQGVHAVGEGRCVHRDETATVRPLPEQDCSFRPRRVEHGSNILHPGLEIGGSGSIGETDAAFVEMDHAECFTEHPHPACVARQLPKELDVREPPLRPQEIDGPPPGHLVGDVDAIRRDRVPGLGNLHRRILGPADPQRNPRLRPCCLAYHDDRPRLHSVT